MLVPRSVTTVGSGAFRGCRALGRVSFQEGSALQKLESYCFFDAGLEQIAIPKSVASIEKGAFCGCARLRKVSFQDGSLLSRIGERCFCESGLEEFRAPPGLREIRGKAFLRCKNLVRVVLNEGLERLVAQHGRYEKSGIFVSQAGIFGQSGLKEIALPDTLREIRGPVFKDCDELEVVWAGGGCAARVRENVRRSVRVLAREAMIGGKCPWELHGLREIAIPDGVKKIGRYWFWGSGAEIVTIPASAREIHARAFYDCRNLKRVVFQGTAGHGT